MTLPAQLLAELKAALEAEQKKLTEELKQIADKDPKIAGHWHTRFPKFELDENASSSSREEEEDEFEEYEEALEAEHSFESRLLAIAHALERIERGTYGACARCGTEIPAERLRANPAAEYDIEHEPK